MITHIHTLNRFALCHDEEPAFHAAYLVLTFLAAALLNVGAFALLVAVHMTLDVTKYHSLYRQSWSRSAIRTLRENIIDLFLLTLALCFAVYLHHAAGVVAVSGLFHVEETLVRGMGMLIPRLEVLWHALAALGNFRKHLERLRKTARGWTYPEALCGVGFVVALTMLLVSPSIIADPGSIKAVLMEQLVPWRI